MIQFNLLKSVGIRRIHVLIPTLFPALPIGFRLHIFSSICTIADTITGYFRDLGIVVE